MHVAILILLYVLTIIFWMNGFGATAQAASAIHQIYAALYFGFGALTLASAGIIHAVTSGHRRQIDDAALAAAVRNS